MLTKEQHVELTAAMNDIVTVMKPQWESEGSCLYTQLAVCKLSGINLNCWMHRVHLLWQFQAIHPLKLWPDGPLTHPSHRHLHIRQPIDGDHT